MQRLDDKLILSASDLNNHLACAHLTTLNLARARGELAVELERGADAELLARKGDEYEDRYLASLKAEGREVVEIAQGDGSHAALLEAARRTEEAMRAGAEVIYQATFLRDGQRGHADFLRRVERPSDLVAVVADTKLARRAKPYFVVQLCFYSELLAAVQGAEPEHIHVILGDGEEHSFRLAEFSAYFRHIRGAFLAALSDGLPDTYPEPVPHCQVCRWRAHCDERRLADDHLSLVANINRRQRELLSGAGIGTLAALGSADPLAVEGIDPGVLERLARRPRCSSRRARAATTATCRATPRRGGASPACPGRRPATSSSTWRGTRSSTTRASSTCSASSPPRAASRGSPRSGDATGPRRRLPWRTSSTSSTSGAGASPTSTSTTTPPT